MGGAAFDVLQSVNALAEKYLEFFSKTSRKNIKNKEFTAIRNREKKYYRSVIASLSGFWTIWSKPAAPGLNLMLKVKY